MDYKIYRMEFSGAVHFGEGNLESSDYTFHADTLFSALCIEALKHGNDELERLVNLTKNNRLLFSDAFPYKKVGRETRFFIPKPNVLIDSEDTGNSSQKKKYKKLKYIDAGFLVDFLSGKYDIENHEKDLKEMGNHEVRTIVNVRKRDEEGNPRPYRVGSYNFNEGYGLYIIIGTDGGDAEELFDDLFGGLSLIGIGGERSSGYGRFDYYLEKMPENLAKGLRGDYNKYLSLSVSLPVDSELDETINNASYQLIKRSGFVASSDYSDTPVRKCDLYVFAPGSVFTRKFSGDIFDVSKEGNHPVYRYAKAMLLGVGA